MKKYTVIIITILFLALSVLGLDFTLKALINKNITQMPEIAKNNVSINFNGTCSDKRAKVGLENSQDPYIKKLNQYQTACNSSITDKWMIFADMPKDKLGAERKANDMATTIKEFNKYGVTPIIIVEPVTDWGLVDFMEFHDGLYDPWIDEFFKDLKAQIPDVQMNAIWVPFPEPNLPYWNRAVSTPQDVAENINKYLSILKKYYPKAHGSILLNAKTYSETDINWENGEYISLLPYVEKIDKNLVDSVGMQGFPWVPQAKSTVAKPDTDPSVFLNSNLLLEIAYYLNVKDVWLNTGTFGTKYSQDSDNIVFQSASERKTILEGIFGEAEKMKSKGYNVSINIFAQDKTDTQEQTNWSYWTDPSASTNERTVFIEFIRKLYDNSIGVSIYDK